MTGTPTVPDKGAFLVDLLARLIPAGASGANEVRAVIALRPIKPPEGHGAVALADWPTAVEKRILPRLKVDVRLAAKPEKDALPSPVNAVQLLSEPVGVLPYKERPDNAVLATDLWKKLVPIGADNEWATFHKALTTIQSAGDASFDQSVVCVAGKQGNMTILAKAARAIETIRLASSSNPSETIYELANISHQAAKEILEDPVLAKIYMEVKSDDKTNNLDITRKKRDYAAGKLEEACAACEAEQAAGEAMCRGTIIDAVDALSPLTPISCPSLDASLPDIYREILDLRQYFLLATALDTEVVKKLEKSHEEGKPYEIEEQPNDQVTAKRVTRRLVELDETPDLGRFFRTYIDVRIPVEDIVNLIREKLPGKSHAFLFLRVDPDPLSDMASEACDPLARWSLAKLTLDPSPSILPATREELLLGLDSEKRSNARPHQRNGVYLLGGTTAGEPEYELVSADLRAAAREIDSRADRMLSLAVATAVAPSSLEPSNLRSGGLSLVAFGCASRLSRMVGVAKATSAMPCEETFLDAEDLSVGRLPMLGIPVGSTEKGYLHHWHVQTRKSVVYDTRALGLNVDIDKQIGDLYPNAELRSLAQATVDRSVSRASDVKGKKVIAPDAAEYTYLGNPMGIETGLRDRRQEIGFDDGIGLGRRISLPGQGPAVDQASLVAPLRFGMSYKLGFAAVYLGGVTLSTEAARLCFQKEEEAASPRAGLGRRFLRSEPVGACAVLIPKTEADSEIAAYRNGRPPAFPPQTTRHVSLRSHVSASAADPAPVSRIGPREMIRIVVPPVVNLQFAELHGVFDDTRPRCFVGGSKPPLETLTTIPPWPDQWHKTGRVRRPRDGLRDVHFDAARGAFPTLTFTEGWGNNRKATVAARFEEGAGWLATARTWAAEVEAREASRANPDPVQKPLGAPPASDDASSDAVFASIRAKTLRQGRVVPFYPDPMTGELVLRLRYGGDPVTAPTVESLPVPFAEDALWPDVRPICLAVRHVSGKPERMLVAGGTTNIEGRPCRRVEVQLPPGVAYALDLWCRPSVAKLKQWSELIDTAATLGLGPVDPASKAGGACGLMGRPAPDDVTLDRVATAVWDTLGKRPLPEISKVRTLTLVHAVDRPMSVPVLQETTHRPRLLARRAAPGVIDCLGPKVSADPAEAMPADWFKGEGREGANAASGGTEVDLGGHLRFDPASTGAVEIIARAVAPKGGELDDPSRRRPRNDVRTGAYSDVLDAVTGNKALPADQKVFGFKVSPNGKVEFVRAVELWARFSNLPADKGGHLSLHALFGAPEAVQNADASDIVSQIHPLFADTRARQVEVRFRSVSRHANAFIRRARIENGEHVPGARLPATETIQESDWSGPVWIPASERPSPPQAAAQALPVIAAEVTRVAAANPTVVSRRLAETRIWLERPWCGSGEGERLGVILWPPVLRRRRASVLPPRDGFTRPSVADGPGATNPGDDVMAMLDFEDRLLPGVGRFLTRWGSDPIEEFPMDGWRDWVVPNVVFRDFEFDRNTGRATTSRRDAGFVRNVALPVPVSTEGTRKAGGDADAVGAAKKRQRFLNVDLLTYEPRFDVATEKWYVDIRLDPGPMISPFLRLGIVRFQEHAPRHLQVSFPSEPLELQVLTQRASKLEVLPVDDAPSRVRLLVTVEGPASWNKTVPCDDCSVTTLMRMRLDVRDRQTGLMRASFEHTVGQDGEGRWQRSFELPRHLLSADLDALVHIEEEAIRLVSSYSDEDLGFKAPVLRDQQHTRSIPTAASPRYLCTLAVPTIQGGA